MKRRQPGILTGMPFMANISARTFVDDTGRKVFLANPPQRIVSLAPNITEMLFALDSGGRVVGITSSCNFPREAAALPKVGGATPSVECIIRLNPDLVLTPRGYLNDDAVRRMSQLKIPLFSFETQTLDDVLRHLSTLGRLLDRGKTADALVGGLRQRIKQIGTPSADRPRPKVLYVFSCDPLTTVGPGNFVHYLIEMAGGTNIAADTTTAFPRLSIESALKSNPDILLLPAGGSVSAFDSWLSEWRMRSALSAIRHTRLVLVDSDLLDRPGPRIVEGLEHLTQAFRSDPSTSDSVQPDPPDPGL
ncbi:MAG: ABC transporter substrate-binding protein [Nitrospiraceae bacterium]